LLNAYERAVYHGEPGAIGDGTLSIPENSNGVADILDEARWNVEFLLSMQVPGDQPLAGMAHHKIHDENWTGLPLPPHQDPQSRYLAPPSTAATLNLAAVAAQCARIWTEIDPGFAALCLNTAESAYAAAQANPDIIANPDDGTGGGPYSDPNVADEFYWAAAELFVSTGSQAYLADLTSHELYFGESFNDRGADWGSTGLLGDITLAVAPNELPAGDVTALRTSFTTAADNLLTIMDDQGYPAPYREVRNGALWYDWGSNNLLLNNAVVLALAHDFTDADPYRDGVFATLDYMLGRNPLSQSYITGYGEQATSNPHHRFWAHQIDASYPSAPPGVLAGGPNSGLQDPLVAAELAGCSPQKCYLDHIDSWSTNEVTINWNSVLSWVAVWAGENLPDGPPPEDSEPPSQPGTPMVSDVTSSSSTLTWSASTDNVGVVGYDVHLDGDVTGTSVPSITLSDLSPDTTYSVYVIARDAADNPSPPSDSVEFTTEPDDDPPGGAECTVTYTSQPWNEGPTHGGFTAHIAMTNAGDQAIDGWTLSFDLPAGQGFTQGWSASWSVSGQTVSATPLSWNEIIAPGQAVEVGFNGTWTGSYANPDTFSCS
jgi:endoglucanase